MTGHTDDDPVVSQLSFGRDDAENDLIDGYLRDGFLPTLAFEEASSGLKTLIVGRQGSGKSAICMRLAVAAEHGGRTCRITPDDAAGDAIRRFELQGVTAETAKSLVWRYVFAVQAARYLVRHVRYAHGNRFARSVRALRKFLRENGEATEEQFRERVIRAGQGLQKSLSLKAFGVNATFERKDTSQGARAERQLDILESGVLRAFSNLDCMRLHSPLLILVDQLELLWSSDQDSEHSVIGLLVAGKHLAHFYRGAIRCVIFVRADIYDTLKFGGADRLHSDEFRIDWNREMLLNLALLRAQLSTRRPLSMHELWSHIFPRQVRGEPIQDYLLARILPRPRDMIQILNRCRDTSRKNGHSIITESDVEEAILKFSEWKLKDLTGEYQMTFPFLDRLFSLFKNTGYLVTRAAVDVRFAPLEGPLTAQFPQHAASFNSDNVIEILCQVGFLGIRRGTDVDYTIVTHKPPQSHEKTFYIHPCFRPALNAVDPTQIKPFKIYTQFSADPANSFENLKISNATSGSDFTIPSRRADLLLEAILQACRRILQQINEVALPIEASQQVSAEIGELINGALEARTRLEDGIDIRPVQRVIRVAAYLRSTADHLTHLDTDDLNNASSIVNQIRDEVRGLIDVIGPGQLGS